MCRGRRTDGCGNEAQVEKNDIHRSEKADFSDVICNEDGFGLLLFFRRRGETE